MGMGVFMIVAVTIIIINLTLTEKDVKLYIYTINGSLYMIHAKHIVIPKKEKIRELMDYMFGTIICERTGCEMKVKGCERAQSMGYCNNNNVICYYRRI